MTPFRFGAPQRRMYGVYHPAESRRAPVAGVVLCNPFGQEAVRTHRLYRLLAERLAREGTHVLRFDYFATGESEGDDAEGDLPGWAADVCTADAEIRRRARCDRVAWFGARLGATLAALASQAADTVPDRLLLWEPVLDGPRYLNELAISNARALHDPYVQDARERVSERIGAEAVGFGVGPALLSELGRIDTTSLSPRAREVSMVAPHGSTGAAGAAASWRRDSVAVREVHLTHGIVWAAEEAMNTALAPTEVIQVLHQELVRHEP